MADSLTITVLPQDAGLRLDVFLARHITESRTKLQKLIKDGQVTINGKTHRPHDLVKAGDILVAETSQPIRPPLAPGELLKPTILDEDDTYLVVNKPSGLIVHGGPGIHEPTLADWAVEHDKKIGDIGDQPSFRPGIVHRLDKDVSGVMVIAKTKQAFDDLKSQFQEHSITKEYTALANGRITSPSGKIAFAIARKADHSGLMVARPGSREGKAAETHFTVIRYPKGFSLCKIKTLTGRTHQIRVHMKAIGHPLVGDPLYKMRKLKISKITPPRIFLHATKLAFDDLKGNRRTYETLLPPDLQQFLDRLG